MHRGFLEAKIEPSEGKRFAVVRLDGGIGPPDGVQARQFVDAITQLGECQVLYLTLNSPGGSLIDTWIIYDFLMKDSAQREQSLALISGECSRDAILIPMAFQRILMRIGSYIQFEPAQLTKATSSRQVTLLIARLIAQRIRRRPEEVLDWMDSNRTLSAEDCLRLSLCDAII
ncbi:MAG: hypothetical protein JO025_00215 [Verrucomicrobia bacterium]|nr:hypothetical protein [Verrucomicrobiota bacterium]